MPACPERAPRPARSSGRGRSRTSSPAPRSSSRDRGAHELKGVPGEWRLYAVGTRPETRYAKSGDVNIAYQVVGDGPVDLVFVPGWISHVELSWEEPLDAAFLGRLAAFSRLILFDKRGTGLSDRGPVDQLPILEERMDDVRAVMDAVGSERAALIGVSEGGPMSALFAATYPGADGCAGPLRHRSHRRIWAPDYPWAPTPDELERGSRAAEQLGRRDRTSTRSRRAADDPVNAALAHLLRHSASPGAALALLRMNTQIDVRDVLPAISVPTLVLHRTRRPRRRACEEGRRIPGRDSRARVRRAPGRRPPAVGRRPRRGRWARSRSSSPASAPRRSRPRARHDPVHGHRRLDRAGGELGDRGWRDSSSATTRWCGASSSGSAARSSTPPATASSPRSTARRAASAAPRRSPSRRQRPRPRDQGRHPHRRVRAGRRQARRDRGPHRRPDRGLAEADEVLVSSTVKDLVVGSGIEFADRGAHELKGVPGEWRLYAVSG